MIVAEKPSVAKAYAKVLGATNRQDGYLEGNGYLVSWCVGHLVELAPPNVYDAKYVKWSIADLPILPEKWQYLVSASTKKQFGILQKLMNRPDVDSIVNSCDSGREGELIFRLVYQQAGCKKPFFRLWLSSMEENAIREGFANLKPSTEYDALYNAALCRERADWMVGINASRLFSCLYGQPLAVGRVMTPVLAMTVVREAAIAAFTPEKFYTVDLELTSGCTASSRRIPEKSVAENLLEACRKEMVATIQRITRKEKSENPPPLYDLTTLQRDANRLLGYSAQQTLDYVQSLYEKKLTTYPRTDSCYITDDDEEMLEELTEESESRESLQQSLESLENSSLDCLSDTLNIEKLKRVAQLMESNMDNCSEEFWQSTVFKENQWVLAQIFSTPCTIYEDKAYVGGKSMSNRDGNVCDFIYQNELSQNIALIEIKTPCTPIIGNSYRATYSFSSEMSGAINQVLNYKDSLTKEFYSLQSKSSPRFEVFNPKCVVIIGRISAMEVDEVAAFERFRNSLNNVTVVTFDELYTRITGLITMLSNKQSE